jgi:hypothetical protein
MIRKIRRVERAWTLQLKILRVWGQGHRMELMSKNRIWSRKMMMMIFRMMIMAEVNL